MGEQATNDPRQGPAAWLFQRPSGPPSSDPDPGPSWGLEWGSWSSFPGKRASGGGAAKAAGSMGLPGACQRATTRPEDRALPTEGTLSLPGDHGPGKPKEGSGPRSLFAQWSLGQQG